MTGKFLTYTKLHMKLFDTQNTYKRGNPSLNCNKYTLPIIKADTGVREKNMCYIDRDFQTVVRLTDDNKPPGLLRSREYYY